MTPHHLHLLTLGTPLLLAEGGEPVRFRTRKHFALLIRLAVEAGRKFTRDYLVDLLWSDAPPQRASHSLAQAISVLKAKVGREHVLVQKATVALADGVVDADVRRLDGRNVEIRGPFLDGFEVPGAASFEQWKDERRARLMAQLRDCLVTQMDAGRRVGDFGTVERHALVLHDLDPLSEDAVRGLMEARAWVGDRSNALKVFGRFEARLAEELGATPSPDLVRIANLLREGRGATPRRHGEEAAPEPRERRFEAETLIGREREFSALYDAWLEARRRTPQIIVLTGDPGIGKTTLTNAFLSTCQMEGAVVIRAQAYDAERELPFAVLAELVKQLALQRAIGGADPDALAELSRLSPEIPRAFPGVPKPPDWSADVMPLRFADAFLKMVEAAAEESPLVVVVDDIHAADNASAAILHMVARKLPRTRLMLILTARPSELRTAAAPAALVTDATVEALRQLELEPLGPEAAERLVAMLAAAADPSRGESPTERILQVSSGNPLAIELLTREWVAHGTSSLLADLEAMNTLPAPVIGIPRAIQGVFERQTRRLDARTRAVLDLAAVLGRRLTDLSLYQAVDCSPSEAAEVLSRLKDEGFLREIHASLEFRNELIRAQAYYAVAGPARQHLHRCVAERLVGRREDQDAKAAALEITWHYLRGGDATNALPCALQGAEAALKVGAPYEAEQVMSASLRECPNASCLRQMRFLLARALLAQSKSEAALAVLETLMADCLSTVEYAEASRMQAIAEHWLSRETGLRAYKAAERALTAANCTSNVELITRALFEYARSGCEVGDEERVKDAEKRVRELLVLQKAQELPSVHYVLAYCHYFSCDVLQAAKCLERTISLLSSQQGAIDLFQAYLGYGVCLHYSCEPRRAVDAYMTAISLARRMGDDARASDVAANLCLNYMAMGDYAGAVRIGKQGVEWGARSADRPPRIGSLMNLAEALLMLGDEQQAFQYLDQAREWMKHARTWRSEVAYLCESACVALMMKNFPAALDLIARAEQKAWGRERAVPDAGGFYTYRVFRTAHTSGLQTALTIAAECKDRFRTRHPLFFLYGVASTAWVEKQLFGRHTPDTEAELQTFSSLGLEGKHATLRAQGFLD